MPERILVTGGAGFVGSSLALAFRRNRSTATVVVPDNLKRRGSELALERLRAGGVEFVHGDVRVSEVSRPSDQSIFSSRHLRNQACMPDTMGTRAT